MKSEDKAQEVMDLQLRNAVEYGVAVGENHEARSQSNFGYLRIFQQAGAGALAIPVSSVSLPTGAIPSAPGVSGGGGNAADLEDFGTGSKFEDDVARGGEEFFVFPVKFTGRGLCAVDETRE